MEFHYDSWHQSTSLTALYSISWQSLLQCLCTTLWTQSASLSSRLLIPHFYPSTHRRTPHHISAHLILSWSHLLGADSARLDLIQRHLTQVLADLKRYHWWWDEWLWRKFCCCRGEGASFHWCWQTLRSCRQGQVAERPSQESQVGCQTRSCLGSGGCEGPANSKDLTPPTVLDREGTSGF